jgi:hypothetical protein
MAFDGANGNLLWNVQTRDEIFASAVFNDITGDAIPEVYIGGRSAEFRAINGADGTVIWEFFPEGDTIDPADSGWYNFYSAQVIPDQNSDGTDDLLVANGGDHRLPSWDTVRPPGHIMLLDGLTGDILAEAAVPDSQETYCSPLLVDLGNNGNYSVVFGTGGETARGSMWIAPLSSLLANDLSAAIAIATDNGRGFIAPPAVADLDGDLILDIIIQGFNGIVYAVNGSTNLPMWTVTIPGSESSTSPTIGNFTGSYGADVFAVTYKGSSPSYFDFYQVLIDGSTGEKVWQDSIADLHFAAPNAFDYNGDGRDEIMVSVNNFTGTHYEHELKLLDFQNDSVVDFYSPEAGVGLASTPCVGDFNDNGKLDIVFSFRADSINPVGNQGIYVKQLSTNIDTSCTDIAWAAYMGNAFDGHYFDDASACGTITMNYIKNSPSCNGLSDGSIFSMPSGGTPPYTYYWDDGTMADSLVGLPVGTYGLTVKDAACCIASASYSVADPNVISFGGISTNLCPGDSSASYQVSSTGCPCMFSGCLFLWSNGDTTKTATGLVAGWNYVTITHTDGCVVTDSVYVSDGAALIDSVVVTAPVCDGDLGSASVYAADTVNTTFDWSNGGTGPVQDSLAPGTYQVYMSDTRPCYDTIEVTVDSVSNTLESGIIAQTDVSCYGECDGSAVAGVGGGTPPYTFQWNCDSSSTVSTISGLCADTCGVTVLDSNGCSSDTSFVISEPAQLVFDSLVVTDATFGSCDGDVLIAVSGGTPSYTFTANGSPSPVQWCPGAYEIIVTDLNGCTISDSVVVGELVGITESLSKKLLATHPNPAMHYFNVNIPENLQGTTYLDLFDVTGKLVLRVEHELTGVWKVERGEVPSGIYQIVLKNGELITYGRVIFE